VLAWNTGLFHEDEVRPIMARTTGIQLLHDTAPEGVLLPNNEASWQRADIDPKEDPNKTPEGTPSPDQGQKNGSGGQSDSTKKDLRRDAVKNERLSDTKHRPDQERRLDRIEEMLEALLSKK